MTDEQFFTLTGLEWQTSVTFLNEVSDFWIHAWPISLLPCTGILAIQYGTHESSPWSLVSTCGVSHILSPWIWCHHVHRVHHKCYGLITAVRSFFVSGKPLMITFFRICNVGSQAVSCCSSLSWWCGTGRKWVVWMLSSSTSVAERSQPPRWALDRNAYWWLCSIPKSCASNSFSIWDYSAEVSALLANVTGWPYYIRAKPSPSWDAPPWVSGSLLMKYFNTGALTAASFICPNVYSCSQVQFQSASLCIKWCSRLHISDRPWINFLRYLVWSSAHIFTKFNVLRVMFY